MGDLIKREDAFKAVLGVTTYDTVDDVEIHCDASVADSEGWLGGVRDALRAIEDVSSAEPNLIHCADCRWWKQDEDIAPYGWCFACRRGAYTEHWDITIRRKYKGDFFCADAEPRIEGEDDDE